ncbi:MAG: N-6 DNA methylase [Gemmatimonadaceae bacterium]
MGTQEMVASVPANHGIDQLGLAGFDKAVTGRIELPRRDDLRVSDNLSSILEACANHIYANDGCLKERAFQEIVKVLFAKLWDEKNPQGTQVRFGITADEFEYEKAGKQSEFTQRIRLLFSEAAAAHPTIFPSDDRLGIKSLTLAFVARSLQEFSLTRTNQDIVGVAFQRLVTSAQRGDRGEYFTPEPVVRLAIDLANPRPGERILDPACGSGGFLLAAMQRIRDGRERQNVSTARTTIRGLDFNPDIARVARLQLAFQFDAEQSIASLNSLDSIATVAEAARLQGVEGLEHNSFDLILTNPPFGSKGKVVDKRILRSFDLGHVWREEEGSWTMDSTLRDQAPDVLFLEQCYRFLKPGGRLAVVLPDGLLQNPSAGYIRHWLLARMHLEASVSLPYETFVPFGTGVKTSLLLFTRHVDGEPGGQRRKVFFAAPLSVGYDVKGRAMHRTSKEGHIQRDIKGRPLIDEDLSQVDLHFKQENEPESDGHFRVESNLVRMAGRIDTQHFVPSVLGMEARLRARGAKCVGQLATIVRRRSSFRRTLASHIRYVALSDVDTSAAAIANVQDLLAFEAPSRATYRIKQGDILVAVSGAAVGTAANAVALVTAEFDGCICSNGFAVLRDIRAVEPLYLLHYLRSEPFLCQAYRRRTGHAIPSLSYSDLEGILVPEPALSDQERFAETARQIFALRANAQEKGKALIKDIAESFSSSR